MHVHRTIFLVTWTQIAGCYVPKMLYLLINDYPDYETILQGDGAAQAMLKA